MVIMIIRWPLNETEGTIAHSVPGGNNGVAVNPDWLLKEHNTWENILRLEFPGEVKTTFDSRNDDLYFLSQDSVYIFNTVNNSLRSIATSRALQSWKYQQLIFNPISNSLVKYSLDNNYLSVFDLQYRWSGPLMIQVLRADRLLAPQPFDCTRWIHYRIGRLWGFHV